MLVIYSLVALVGFVFLAILLRLALNAYLTYRGTCVVTCPETHQRVPVKVDTTYAAMTNAIGILDLRLKACSLWPEHHGCGQECLRQIEAAPEECLVRTLISRWYAGKSCVCCGKRLGDINWMEHKPGLLDTQGKTLGWHEIQPDRLPELLTMGRPVCWDCYIAESFRQHFPDLVVERHREHEEHPTDEVIY